MGPVVVFGKPSCGDGSDFLQSVEQISILYLFTIRSVETLNVRIRGRLAQFDKIPKGMMLVISYGPVNELGTASGYRPVRSKYPSDRQSQLLGDAVPGHEFVGDGPSSHPCILGRSEA